MARTKYDIHKEELYSRAKIEEIISKRCEKRKIPVPNFTPGRISTVAKEIGVKPECKEGNSYVYRGADATKIIDKVMARREKKSGKRKKVKSSDTEASPSTKPMAKPSQISIDDISRNTKYDQLIDKLWDCIGILESMKEK